MNQLETPSYEIRVGTADYDSFYIGIKPPLNLDPSLSEQVYNYLDTRPIRRSVGMFVDASCENSLYTEILVPICGPEEKDIAMLGIAQVMAGNGYTVKLNTKPVVYKDNISNLFAEK